MTLNDLLGSGAHLIPVITNTYLLWWIAGLIAVPSFGVVRTCPVRGYRSLDCGSTHQFHFRLSSIVPRLEGGIS